MNKCFSITAAFCFVCVQLLALGGDVTLYCLPGMGTDHRVYEGFDFGAGVNKKVIHWPENATELEGLHELAKALVEQIDTTEKFILLGNSMGGMLSMELSQMVSPEAIILVASVKSSKEIPFRYKLGRVIPGHKLLREKRLIRAAEDPKTFKDIEDEDLRKIYPEMLKDCGSEFLKWQMDAIVHWKLKDIKVNCPVYHIHGKKDHVLPLRKTSADIILKRGTHKLVANNRTDIITYTRQFLSEIKLI